MTNARVSFAREVWYRHDWAPGPPEEGGNRLGLYSTWDFGDPNHNPAMPDVGAWPGTVGGQIMAACAHHNATTEVGMDAIVAEFQNIGWAWNPKRSGRSLASGTTLLDRTAAGSGECGWLAWALHVLLEVPAPYGFGRAGLSTPRVYSGLNDYDQVGHEGEGFVATHVGVHHGRPANVARYDPHSPMVGLSNEYKWGDHVVVEYAVNTGTFFWDPSYNTKYARITDMAAHRIVQVDTILDRGVPIGQHLRLNGNQWMRTRDPAEINYNPHTAYLGPEPNQIPDAVRAPTGTRTCIIL